MSNRIIKSKLTPEDKERIYARYGGRCAYCGHLLDATRSDGGVGMRCIDHVEPKSGAGTNDESNLMPACWNCNSIKHARPLEFLRRYRGFQQTGYAPIITLTQYDRLVAAGASMAPIPFVTFYFEQKTQ